MKSRPIGERFKDGKVTLEVRKDQGFCSGCYYGHAPFCGYQTNRSLTGACGAWSRGNGESVVFVRVTDDFDKLKVEVERQKKEIDRLQRIINNRPSQA
jgi:hypothetical protein